MISREIYTEYVYEIVKLKIWYLKWIVTQGIPFDYGINNHVNIFKFTSKIIPGESGVEMLKRRDNDPVWQKLKEDIREKIEREHVWLAFTDMPALEQECFALLKPYMDKYIDQYLQTMPTEDNDSFGCFSYGEPAGGSSNISLHFRNRFIPESPFSHENELRQSLIDLINDVMKKYPDVTNIQMTSWLSRLPKFAALFPAEWLENARPIGRDTGDGCWGQFVDRRGGFNYRMAEILRSTGQFAFVNSYCSCEIDRLLEHLSL